MRIVITAQADKDLSYWQKTNNDLVFKTLLMAIHHSPFKGLGKPESLKQNLKGYWSRRITQEHRLVYIVADNCITILQCRFHY